MTETPLVAAGHLFLNAWFMSWNFLLEIPTGTVADFLGRKFFLVLGIAAIVFSFVPNIKEEDLID
jgi:hypothetical protein